MNIQVRLKSLDINIQASKFSSTSITSCQCLEKHSLINLRKHDILLTTTAIIHLTGNSSFLPSSPFPAGPALLPSLPANPTTKPQPHPCPKPKPNVPLQNPKKPPNSNWHSKRSDMQPYCLSHSFQLRSHTVTALNIECFTQLTLARQQPTASTTRGSRISLFQY